MDQAPFPDNPAATDAASLKQSVLKDSKDAKHKGPDQRVIQLSRQVSEVLSRLRLLEERYANVRREHQITTHNMVENHQNLSKQLRRLNDGVVELKHAFSEVADQIKSMQGELADTARSFDVKALQRYVDLWQPLDFVTRQQAEEMLAQALEKYINDGPKR